MEKRRKKLREGSTEAKEGQREKETGQYLTILTWNHLCIGIVLLYFKRQ